MNQLFIMILRISISASGLLIAAIALHFLLKKLPKKYMYALWLLVLLKLVVPFEIPILPSQSSINIVNLPVDTEQLFIGNTDYNIISNQEELQNENKIIVNKNEIGFQIWNIWILGILILLSFQIINIKDIYDKVRFAFKKEKNIYYCDEINMPFVLGCLKPKIYLPCEISEKDEQYVLSHEEFHIKRKDYLIKPIYLLVCIMHWFNPLVWIGYYLMEKDMEMSCDEMVVKNKDNQYRKGYAKTLLNFSINTRPQSLNLVLFGEDNCSMRIKNVLNFKEPKKLISLVAVSIIILSGVTAFATGKNIPESNTESVLTEKAEDEKEIKESTIIDVDDKSKLEFTQPMDMREALLNRGFHEESKHYGIDIAGPTGTNIYAVESGTVITSSFDTKGKGNYIVIEHNDQYQTVYSQCKDLFVKEGDIVEKGELIASLGSTGNSTGPHLHFEVIENGVNIDPCFIFES